MRDNRIRGVESVADKEAHTVQVIKINSQPGAAHVGFKMDSWHWNRKGAYSRAVSMQGTTTFLTLRRDLHT